jgi:hypothetical protein
MFSLLIKPRTDDEMESYKLINNEIKEDNYKVFALLSYI